ADRALWLVIACPLTVVHIIGGTHNDGITVGLMIAGLAVATMWPARTLTLLAGGVIIGLGASGKVSGGVVLPVVAVLAAGAPVLPVTWQLIRRAGTVLVAGIGTVVGLSFASGFGLGWIQAISGTGISVVWTSPPTAVGLAIGYIGRVFGLHL